MNKAATGVDRRAFIALAAAGFAGCAMGNGNRGTGNGERRRRSFPDRLEERAKAEAPAAPVAAAPVAQAAVGNTEQVSTKPEIQNGIADETVAAISGAIACMAPAGKQYAVRSIMKK